MQGRTAHTMCGTYLLASSLAAALPAERRVLARQGWAGENRRQVEHPVDYSDTIPMRNITTEKTEYAQY
jgi:hypothetical protein